MESGNLVGLKQPTRRAIMFYEILGVVLISPILGYLANRFYFSGARCKSKNRLDDKVAIITGGNTGIGYYTALDFAKRGAHVILACRDLIKAEKAATEIKKLTGNRKIEVEHLDLADLDSIRSFADKMRKGLTKLDLLVNNAGIMMCPKWRTKQGFEMQFGTNHLGTKNHS
jgi:retinol dehydrogenase-12